MTNKYGTTRVIGNWKPKSVESKEDIIRRFKRKLKSIIGNANFFLEHCWIQTTSNGQANKWHRDGSNHTDAYFIAWSNKQPTEVMFESTGNLLKAKDGDIILVNNLEVKHRTPPNADKNRWFLRLWNLSNCERLKLDN